MKKLFFIAFVALTTVTVSAFTLTTQAEKNSTTDLYWFNESGVYSGTGTKSSQITSSCPDGSGAICQSGYDDNDLVTPGVPEEGLLMDAEANDEIRKP